MPLPVPENTSRQVYVTVLNGSVPDMVEMLHSEVITRSVVPTTNYILLVAGPGPGSVGIEEGYITVEGDLIVQDVEFMGGDADEDDQSTVATQDPAVASDVVDLSMTQE